MREVLAHAKHQKPLKMKFTENRSFDLKEWSTLIQARSSFATNKDCEEFERLLGEARNNISKEVVRQLMRTFSDADDFEIQENTRILLEPIEKSMYYPILPEEIEGISRRSPEKRWDMSLIGIELYSNTVGDLLNLASKADKKQIGSLRGIISSNDFVKNYPDIRPFLNQVNQQLT